MKNTITLCYKGNVTIVVRAYLVATKSAVENFCKAIREYEEFDAGLLDKEIKKRTKEDK